MRQSVVAAIVLLLLAFSGCAPEGRETITVHVAASMSDAVQQIADNFTNETSVEIQLNIASSGTLARQIVSGAPADVFISANTEWMDYLMEKHGLVAGSRHQVAGNRLVVIVPLEAAEQPKSTTDIPEFAQQGIALGDPSHVPAGNYAKKALERAGIWDKIEDQLVPALDVRAALAYVERGEVGIGIVYASDTLLSEAVHVAFMIPADFCPPIVYEAAIPRKANGAAAQAFLNTVHGSVGKFAFKKFGFTVATVKQ